MNRTRLVKGLIFAAAAMMVASIPAGAQQVAKLTPAELTTIRAEVARAGAVSLWAVTEDFTGSFQSVAAASETVKQQFASQNLGASIGSFQVTGILILPEDPTGKSQFRMSVGFTVPGSLPVRPPLKIQQIRYSTAVRHTHVGAYPELEHVYRGIGGIRSASFPVVLRLIDDPLRVPAQWLRTELIVPVK